MNRLRLLVLLLVAVLVGCQRPAATSTSPAASPTATPTEAGGKPTPPVAFQAPKFGPAPQTTPADDSGKETAGLCTALALSSDPEGEQSLAFTDEVEELFLLFTLENVPEGTMLRSEWTFLGREAEFSASEATAAFADSGTLALERPRAGWPIGDYRVVLYLGDKLGGRLAFTIEQAAAEIPAPELTPEPSAGATPAPSGGTTHSEAGLSPQQLARKLVAGKRSDRDRARALFDWLAANISYDTEAYFSGNYGDCSADNVLRRRTGVCSGYANLFKAMADEVGLESEVVSGFSKGYGFDPDKPLTESDHAWNAVKLAGRWHLLDATWGSGYIDERKKFVRRVEPHWFLTDPEQFLYSHLPDDPRWQLLSREVTREQYQRMPQVKPTFFEYELKLSSHQQAVVKMKATETVEIKTGRDCGLSARLEREGEPLPGRTLVEATKNGFRVHLNSPAKGSYDLLIFAGPATAGHQQLALSYRVQSQAGTDQVFPDSYGDFVTRRVEVVDGRSGELKRKRNTSIAVKAPQALELFIKDGERRLPLKEYKGVYSLDFAPEDKEVTLFGKFEEGRYSNALLKYSVVD